MINTPANNPSKHNRASKEERSSRALTGSAKGAARVPEVEREEITTANGLLYRNGHFINLPEADSIAFARGYHCAEQLVRALEAAGKKTVAPKPGHSPSDQAQRRGEETV